MTITAELLTALWKTLVILFIGSAFFCVVALLVMAICCWLMAVIDDHNAESPTNCNYMGRNLGNKK